MNGQQLLYLCIVAGLIYLWLSLKAYTKKRRKKGKKVKWTKFLKSNGTVFGGGVILVVAFASTSWDREKTAIEHSLNILEMELRVQEKQEARTRQRDAALALQVEILAVIHDLDRLEKSLIEEIERKFTTFESGVLEEKTSEEIELLLKRLNDFDDGIEFGVDLEYFSTQRPFAEYSIENPGVFSFEVVTSIAAHERYFTRLLNHVGEFVSPIGLKEYRVIFATKESGVRYYLSLELAINGESPGFAEFMEENKFSSIDRLPTFLDRLGAIREELDIQLQSRE